MNSVGEWIVQVTKEGQSLSGLTAIYGPTHRHIIRKYLRQQGFTEEIPQPNESWKKTADGEILIARLRSLTEIRFLARDKRRKSSQ